MYIIVFFLLALLPIGGGSLTLSAVPAEPVQAASTAANAANAAANAVNAASTAAVAASTAAVAANTAANAAASANTAADAAASANTAGDAAASATAAASAAGDAKTAAHAAATANMAANAAASASTAATQAKAAASSAASQARAAVAVAAVAPIVPAHGVWSTSQWYILQVNQLAACLTFAMIVKALCVAGNVLVQVSPFPQVKRWESRGCTGEADAAPYVSIAFGGCQWCFYGAFAWIVTSRSGFLVLVHSNLLGAVLGMYYVRAFYQNCRNEASLASLQKYLSAVTALALLQVCAMGVLPMERALFLTGLVSSFCSFVGATSVLVTVPAVVRTKDSRSIPGPYALANFFSSLVWSLCGYLLDDPLVMVPNLFACVCSGTSLSLKVLYPSDIFPSEKFTSLLEEGIEAPERMRAASVAKRAHNIGMPTEFTPMRPIAAARSEDTGRKAPTPLAANLDSGYGAAVAAPVAADLDSGYGADGTGGTW